MTLAQVGIGQHAVIQQVRGEGPLRRRLLEMGLTPNTFVCVRKMAPMGDPMELRVRGYSLTLRKEDADLIDVQNVDLTDKACVPCPMGRRKHRFGGRWRD